MISCFKFRFLSKFFKKGFSKKLKLELSFKTHELICTFKCINWSLIRIKYNFYLIYTDVFMFFFFGVTKFLFIR